MARRTIRTPKKRGRFLAELARTGHVLRSARSAGLGRRTVYDWRAADPAFRAAWDEAIEGYTEVLEAEADRRAVEGSVARIVVDKNGTVHEQRHFSDVLLMFRLKALKPHMYKDRVEHSGKRAAPVYIQAATQRQARIDALLGQAGRV